MSTSDLEKLAREIIDNGEKLFGHHIVRGIPDKEWYHHYSFILAALQRTVAESDKENDELTEYLVDARLEYDELTAQLAAANERERLLLQSLDFYENQSVIEQHD